MRDRPIELLIDWTAEDPSRSAKHSQAPGFRVLICLQMGVGTGSGSKHVDALCRTEIST